MHVEKRSSGFLDNARATLSRSAGGSAERSGIPVICCSTSCRVVLAVERPLAGQQLLVDDGQAVLVAVPADPAVERLRRRVHRRDAAGQIVPRVPSRSLTSPKSATLTWR